MAEEKAFEATQSRLERAKREGDAARSQELGNVAAFAGALAASACIVPMLSRAFNTMMQTALSGRIDPAVLAAMGALTIVPALCAALAAIICSSLQTGGLRVTSISIKIERLSPAENLKRMLSREAIVTAVRATVAFICAAGAIVPAFIAIYSVALHAGGILSIADATWTGALRTAIVAVFVGAVFALADYGLQLARWRKRLRMSHEEMKRDQKEHDGDPLARSRRRSLHRQISRGSLRRVKDAAFIVTNPTHIAIALEYRPPDVPVPRVLVRAADESAARVRDLAAAYGIPLVENVPLARQLYATTEPGAYIPHEAYVAVAEVVAALLSSTHAAVRSDPRSG